MAGHTLVEDGMFSSLLRVGRMMLKPETKYSVRIWLIATAMTNVTSERAFLKHGGLSLPSRCIFWSSVSSSATIVSVLLRAGLGDCGYEAMMVDGRNRKDRQVSLLGGRTHLTGGIHECISIRRMGKQNLQNNDLA